MRDRNAGDRGDPERRRDAGDDLPRDAGPRERLHFLAPSPEEERVPTFEAYHDVTPASVLDQEPVDVLLKCGSGS